MTISTKADASAEYDKVMELIDSVSEDADGYSQDFIKERLINGNEETGYYVEYGSILHTLVDHYGDYEAAAAVNATL